MENGLLSIVDDLRVAVITTSLRVPAVSASLVFRSWPDTIAGRVSKKEEIKSIGSFN